MAAFVLPFTHEAINGIRYLFFPSPPKELSEPAQLDWANDEKIYAQLIWLARDSGCQSFVIEPYYLDRDFSQNFSAFYSTIFQSPTKRTTRIHFFRAKADTVSKYIGDRRDVSKLDDSRVRFLQKNYIGFSILLPIERGLIGRSVLLPPTKHDLPLFCISRCTSTVNLEGIPLRVTGVPYLHQDGQVGVCGTTAIWMLARFMQLRYGFQRYAPSEITVAANTHKRINRPFPAIRGLSDDQIVSAFFELGYTPIVYDKKVFPSKEWKPKELVYKYIESDIPVIAILNNNHAVVVIGHDMDCRYEGVPKKAELYSNSELISSFVVHDDELGPYLLMPNDVIKVTPGSAKFYLGEGFNYTRDEPNRYARHTISQITQIIVPTFSKVYLEGKQIDDLVRYAIISNQSWLMMCYKEEFHANKTEISKDTRELADKFCGVQAALNASEGCGAEGNGPLFFRARFVLSSKFKESVLLDAKGLPEALRRTYSELELPRYIWVVEFSFGPENSCKCGECLFANPCHGSVIGELLIDATGLDTMESVIAAHFPGILITTSAYDSVVREKGAQEKAGVPSREQPVGITVLKDDQPYVVRDEKRYVPKAKEAG